VPQDDVEAAKWYRRAAEQGNAASQMMLAILYFGGIGVPKDLCLACMWTTIAGRDGQVPIKELRDQVIGEMTPAQIAEAENLARDWKPTITNPALR
jgi:uncharacterized protein